jgi:hypothetical protein
MSAHLAVVPPNATGRPTKLDAGRMDAIVAATKAGNTRRAAAAAAGVHIDTLAEWLRRGARGDAGFATFAAAVREADAGAEVSAVSHWVAQFGDDWRACRDFLARRFPDDWGPTQRTEVELSGPGGESLFPPGRVMVEDPEVRRLAGEIRSRLLALDAGTIRTPGE